MLDSTLALQDLHRIMCKPLFTQQQMPCSASRREQIPLIFHTGVWQAWKLQLTEMLVLVVVVLGAYTRVIGQAWYVCPWFTSVHIDPLLSEGCCCKRDAQGGCPNHWSWTTKGDCWHLCMFVAPWHGNLAIACRNCCLVNLCHWGKVIAKIWMVSIGAA